MPGQMISVNKYNVQVERFLSQGEHTVRLWSELLMTLISGGFAHVYLVRTAEPVFNTTHHVLKRIAVANEEMLNEVKKEVDIMVTGIPKSPPVRHVNAFFAEDPQRTPQHCLPHRRRLAPDG